MLSYLIKVEGIVQLDFDEEPANLDEEIEEVIQTLLAAGLDIHEYRVDDVLHYDI